MPPSFGCQYSLVSIYRYFEKASRYVGYVSTELKKNMLKVAEFIPNHHQHKSNLTIDGKDKNLEFTFERKVAVQLEKIEIQLLMELKP